MLRMWRRYSVLPNPIYPEDPKILGDPPAWQVTLVRSKDPKDPSNVAAVSEAAKAIIARLKARYLPTPPSFPSFSPPQLVAPTLPFLAPSLRGAVRLGIS